MRDVIDMSRLATSTVIIREYDEQDQVVSEHRTHNKIMYGSADIIGMLMAGQTNYLPSNMFFEFENGSPSTITAPAYTKADGVSYYTSLVAPRDFLNIPLTLKPAISASSPEFESNVVTLFGRTSATQGVNGLPFSEAAGSVIFGGAVVAVPDPEDFSASKIYGRAYWTDRLQVKHDGKQIGIEWILKFLVSGEEAE